MSKGLNVLISTGDVKLSEINRVFEGHECVENTRLSSTTLLGNRGNGVMPIMLLSHANAGRFTVHNSSRLSGGEVINQLRNRGLIFESYAFIFLAGCNGAAGDLYQDVARASGLATLASTTEVRMTKSAAMVSFMPEGVGGEWKVFDPKTLLTLSLNDASYVWFRVALRAMDITLLS